MSLRSAISPSRSSISRVLLEDVFFVDVAQLDLRHVIRLNLVDAEADHQVGHDLVFQLRLPDDGDGLVDVQQDSFQTFQQVQPVFLLLQIWKIDAPA